MADEQKWNNWSLTKPPIPEAYMTAQGWVIDRPSGVPEILVAISTPNPLTAKGVASITNILLPTKKTYTVGQNMDFTVVFNEPVDVTNTPRLSLTLTSGTVFANYLSGTGTNKIKFRYTVSAADIDLNGIVIADNVGLNTTGTIKDKGTALDSTITFTGSTYATSTIFVDAVVRTISSVSATAGDKNTGEFVDITVAYNQPVIVTTTGGVPSIPMFANDGTTPLAGTSATYLSGSGTANLIFRYTVLAGDSQATDIKAGANIALNSGTIRDTSNTVNAAVTFVQTTLTGVTLNQA